MPQQSTILLRSDTPAELLRLSIWQGLSLYHLASSCTQPATPSTTLHHQPPARSPSLTC